MIGGCYICMLHVYVINVNAFNHIISSASCTHYRSYIINSNYVNNLIIMLCIINVITLSFNVQVMSLLVIRNLLVGNMVRLI